MNQGKLQVVKQEMARMDIDILRISKLKWTEWMNLTQMTIIIYYYRQESLRRNGVAIIVKKERRIKVKFFTYLK